MLVSESNLPDRLDYFCLLFINEENFITECSTLQPNLALALGSVETKLPEW